ncbi:MAG: hypothetical protein K940chlam5_00980 [Candidatus Anoxychlamydiales bacterium]|nr:hypothetical protein [Candidatus Anoxychlamydiales bacterium]
MKFWLLIVLIPIALVPFALKADLTKKLLFSNKNYAKQIEVKTYILTQEQVAQLFKEPNKEPIQLTIEELNKISNETKNRYIVIRVKNLGNLHAWGVLSCKTGLRNPIMIGIPSIKPTYSDYVICISGIFIASPDQNIYPATAYEWTELYTK